MPKKHPRRLFLRIFCLLFAGLLAPVSAPLRSSQSRRPPDVVRPRQHCMLHRLRNFVSPLQAKKRCRKICDTSFFSVDFLLFLLIRSPANKSSQCAFFYFTCSRSYEQIFQVNFKLFHWRAPCPNLLLLICKIISKK